MSFLKKNIINFEPKFLGIDINDSGIRVFQIERDGGRDKIRSVGFAKIKKGSIENGKVIDKVGVIEAIKKALETASPKKVDTKKVICSLPESKAFLRIINIPKIKEKEAEEAVKWEMEANIPLPIDSVYFDWQFIDGEVEKKQKVLTVAVHKEIVDSLTEILMEAGLEPYVFEVESIASARSLITENENKNDLDLIIDISESKTSFTIVEDKVPCFTSSIPFSLEGIKDKILKGLNINEAEAEKIKNDYGIENPLKGNPVLASVKSVMENLVTEIENTVDFYTSSLQKGKDVDRIIICGEGANLKGVVPFLTRRLKKEIEIGDPWVNMNLGNNLPTINREESVKYSTAIGLALRGFYYED